MSSIPSFDPYILIVDDNPDTQFILSRILEALGWESDSAGSGVAALEKIAQRPPALILLDVMMPRMNGFETLARLKRDPSTSPIPVIIISALGHDRRFIRLGACDVLPKGQFTLPDIQNAVEHVLGESSGSTPTKVG